jgi:hypothetical protein
MGHLTHDRPDGRDELLHIGWKKTSDIADSERVHPGQFSRIDDEAALAQLRVKPVEVERPF